MKSAWRKGLWICTKYKALCSLLPALFLARAIDVKAPGEFGMNFFFFIFNSRVCIHPAYEKLNEWIQTTSDKEDASFRTQYKHTGILLKTQGEFIRCHYRKWYEPMDHGCFLNCCCRKDFHFDLLYLRLLTLREHAFLSSSPHAS